MSVSNVWRSCGSCKKSIGLGETYLACGIASCRKSAYCSMACFDAHSPVFRHKDAWAEERRAPLLAEHSDNQKESRISSARLVAPSTASSEQIPKDILVVASKLKDYIRARSGLQTSATVLERLSEIIRLHCDKAIERAHADGRKTVMDRDFYS